MILRLSVGTVQLIGMILSREDYLPVSQSPFFPDGSLHWIEASCVFPIHISMFFGGIHTQFTFSQS